MDSGNEKGVEGCDSEYSWPRMPSGEDCSDVFAGLGLDETPGLMDVAGVIANGTTVSTLMLDGFRANKDGEYQVRLLFATTGDEMAMLGRSALAAESLEGCPQSAQGIGTYKGERENVGVYECSDDLE